MLLFAALFSIQAYAVQLETTCGQVDAPPAYSYCVHKTTGSTNSGVMYFLHGIGESAKAWEDMPPGQKIRDVWEAAGKNPPTVVVVSYGPAWFLAAKNSSSSSGLYEDFVTRVMPNLEGQVLHSHFAKRLLFGESMGGYNATKLYLLHPELFSRVVLGCPALIAVSPYAPMDEILAYKTRNHVNDPTMKVLMEIGHQYWPTPEAYNADAPLSIADQHLNASFPPLHISCGDRDGYGFQEGAKIFADQAAAHGVQVNWTLLSGGHCTMDTTSIANFLLP